MAVEVTRSLKEIREEVVLLDKDIKSLSRENKNLDRSLRLDPTSTVLLSEKTKNLKNQVILATDKVKALRKAQVQMEEDIRVGKVSASEFEKLRLEIAKAKAEAKSFSASLDEINKQRFDKIKSGLKSISKLATLALTSLVAFGVSYASTGDEIQKAVKRYRVSAEEYQKSAFIFERATSTTDAYKTSLEAVTSSLASLAKGSSKMVSNFAALGLSWEDLKGKSPAASLDIFLSRLSLIEDADERASMATVILGNAGVYLAQVASLSADEINELNKQLERNGIITSEETEKAAKLNDKFQDFTYALKKATAELGVSLMPLLEALLKIATIVTPVISGLANAFSSMGEPVQKALAFTLIGLILLPKLITIITSVKAAIIGIKTALLATNTAMLATNKAAWLLGTNPIALKVLLIASAVTALIFLLVKLANWLSEIFGGKKYEADVALNFGGAGSNLVQGANEGYHVQNQTNVQNGGTTVSNYYDYSTMNNTVTKDADIDDIAERLSTKIKVGGAK